MKKKLFNILFIVLAMLLLSSCGGNSEEDCSYEQKKIDTLSGIGVVNFDQAENKWAIHGFDSVHLSYACFPISFPKAFQNQGLKVKFKGDIYEYHHLEHNGEYTYIVGLHYYQIDLINIDKYE